MATRLNASQLGDNGVDSRKIKDGSIDLVDLSTAVRTAMGNSDGRVLRAAPLASNFITSSTAYVATGVSVPVEANTTYIVDARTLFTVTITGNGIGVAFNGPAGSTFAAQSMIPLTPTTAQFAVCVGYNNGGFTVSSSIPAAAFYEITTSGVLVTGATAGTLSLLARAGKSAQSVTVWPGTILRLERISP